MFQSIYRIDTFPPVEFEKLGEQRDGDGTLTVATLLVDSFCVGEFGSRGTPECNSLSKDIVKIATSVLEILHPFTAWQGRPSRHVFFGRAAHKVEDDMRLIEIATT